MNLIINAIDLVFTLLIFAIIARAIVSWLPLDRYHPAIQILDSITEPILAPLRRVIPSVGMMDITPIVALIGLQILQAIIRSLLIRY
ncbi:MAG: YggT family protein [Chloroflexi bacterium]|nr:YggT family protein [Chloroflexota bacterium]